MQSLLDDITLTLTLAANHVALTAMHAAGRRTKTSHPPRPFVAVMFAVIVAVIVIVVVLFGIGISVIMIVSVIVVVVIDVIIHAPTTEIIVSESAYITHHKHLTS